MAEEITHLVFRYEYRNYLVDSITEWLGKFKSTELVSIRNELMVCSCNNLDELNDYGIKINEEIERCISTQQK